MDNIAEKIRAKYPNIILETLDDKGQAAVRAKKEGVKDLLNNLRKDPDFDFNILIDLFAVDYLHWEEKETRFEVVYNLFSMAKNHRLFVKVAVPEAAPELDSATGVWPAADWYERETWDMFGIVFKGHSNLKRILMYESFQGHPLRKDYPYNRRQPLIGPQN